MDWINLVEALAGRVAPQTLNEETRAEYDRIDALRGSEPALPPNPVDVAADHFWAQANQYIEDVAADLKRLGLDPDGPESGDYYAALAALSSAQAQH